MNNPQYVKLDGKLYKINSDFRVALECNELSENTEIGDVERALAIIYKLFSEEGLDCENQGKLLELGLKFLTLGKSEEDFKSSNKEKYELDFKKCEGLIRSSFKFDYNYDPYEMEYLHWYDFYRDLENLSSSEFGTCCALNRMISVLEMDTSLIKDTKQVSKIKEVQADFRKKYCKQKYKELNTKEKTSVVDLYKSLGLWKGENRG